MKFHENQWEAMKINENPSNSMKIYENQWKSMKIYEIKSNQIISNQLDSTQIKSNQIKSNQIKSNQIKSNQIKSNQPCRLLMHWPPYRRSLTKWRTSLQRNGFKRQSLTHPHDTRIYARTGATKNSEMPSYMYGSFFTYVYMRARTCDAILLCICAWVDLHTHKPLHAWTCLGPFFLGLPKISVSCWQRLGFWKLEAITQRCACQSNVRYDLVNHLFSRRSNSNLTVKPWWQVPWRMSCLCNDACNLPKWLYVLSSVNHMVWYVSKYVSSLVAGFTWAWSVQAS